MGSNGMHDCVAVSVLYHIVQPLVVALLAVIPQGCDLGTDFVIAILNGTVTKYVHFDGKEGLVVFRPG